MSPGARGGRGYDDNAIPPAAGGKQVILLDTDHLWGIGGDRAWVWKSFLRGHNPIFMDTLPEITEHVLKYPKAAEVRAALGHTRFFAERMNLAAMTPRGELASTGYCLVNPGKEYLIYLPEGGEATVDLSAAKSPLAVEWFNPRTGDKQTGGQVGGGAERVFRAPFASDAVLYLRKE